MKTKKQMYEELMSKASGDADFRQALLSDPKNAISEEFDIKIPDGIEIRVHESDLNIVHLSLPPDPRVLDQGALNAATGGQGCGDDGCVGSNASCG